MKKTIIICTVVSVLLSLAGLALLSPTREAQQRFYRASNKLERIADRKENSDEFRQAGIEERLTIENLYMLHSAGRGCLWLAALFSSTVLVIEIVSGRRKGLNQPVQPTPGSVTSRADARAAPDPSVADF